jgi:glutathione S-transferase
MLLYYSPGACSLADRIALKEAGVKFDQARVDLKTHQLEDGRAFTDINPKGYVPALELDNGELLTENIAILSMIAEENPALMPAGSLGRARLLEMLAYLSTEIHKAFSPLFNPNTSAADKTKATGEISKRLAFVADRLKGPYLFGEKPTVADTYLFVMLMWAQKNNITLPPALTQFKDKMQARPAVQEALKDEGLA